MNPIMALLAGALFGVGLVVSQMTNANKMVNFLNVAGDWDPSLALVMVGAIGIHVVLFRLVLRRPSPLMAEAFAVPTRRDITLRLVGGSALFGIGWALSGFCPGPGIVSLPSGGAAAAVFCGTLLVGMFAGKLYRQAVPEVRPTASAAQPKPAPTA